MEQVSDLKRLARRRFAHWNIIEQLFTTRSVICS